MVAFVFIRHVLYLNIYIIKYQIVVCSLKH